MPSISRITSPDGIPAFAAGDSGATAPIVGATKPNHLTDAVAALQVKLAAEEIASLEEPYVAHPVVGFS